MSQSSRNGSVYKETQQHVDRFADEGLRTLFLAEKTLDKRVYEEWNKKSQAAKLEIKDRDEKVAAVDELIETDLELIGATAIEDRLQDEVQDTIKFLKKAGIKVWVLTGDKIETAMNIGVSAGLLDSSMEQYIVDETEFSELKSKLEGVKQQADSPANKGTK